MLLINEFKRPARLNLYDAPEDYLSLQREDFDLCDPHGFKLNAAETAFYKANNRTVNPGFSAEVDTLMYVDCDHPNEPHFSDRFELSHSYTQYRCNYKGNAYKAIQEHANRNIHQARILLQLRPKWGITFLLYAKSSCDTMFELLSLDYCYISYTDFNNSADKICNKLMELDWDNSADKIWDKCEEWELLSLYEQRQWKCKLLLGLDTHYSHITSLK